MLSGGLTAENVAAGIAAVEPFAVDVASGVEASPGIKDPDKLAAFFAAVPVEAPRREPARAAEVPRGEPVTSPERSGGEAAGRVRSEAG